MLRIPFTEDHLDRLEPPAAFAAEKPFLVAACASSKGRGVSWVDDGGNVALSAGYVCRGGRVYWLWCLPSKKTPALRHLLRFFEQWVAVVDTPARFEAAVRADIPTASRLAERLGMTRETDEPMRRWDGENDYHLYSRIKRDDHANQIQGRTHALH